MQNGKGKKRKPYNIKYEVRDFETQKLIASGDREYVAKQMGITVEEFKKLQNNYSVHKNGKYIIERLTQNGKPFNGGNRPYPDYSLCVFDCFNCPYPDCRCPDSKIKPVKSGKYVRMNDGIKEPADAPADLPQYRKGEYFNDES